MSDFVKTLPILRKVIHSPNLVSLYVENTVGEVAPGRFFLLWLPGVDEKPFSVSNVTPRELEFTIRGIGPASNGLCALEPGQFMGVRGPFGKGFSLRDNTLVVGGGCGVAPVRYLTHQLEHEGRRHRLVVGTRTAGDLMFASEYGKAPNVLIATEDGSAGEKARVDVVVRRMLASGPWSCIAAAGPEPMLLAMMNLSREFGVTVQLSFERYMKCGIGICGQCCMDGSGIRLCVEGPVLSETDLASITELGLPHRDATGRRTQQHRCDL